MMASMHRDKQYSSAQCCHVKVIIREERWWTAVIYDTYRALLTALYIVADAIEYKTIYVYIYIYTHTLLGYIYKYKDHNVLLTCSTAFCSGKFMLKENVDFFFFNLLLAFTVYSGWYRTFSCCFLHILCFVLFSRMIISLSPWIAARCCWACDCQCFVASQIFFACGFSWLYAGANALCLWCGRKLVLEND